MQERRTNQVVRTSAIRRSKRLRRVATDYEERRVEREEPSIRPRGTSPARRMSAAPSRAPGRRTTRGLVTSAEACEELPGVDSGARLCPRSFVAHVFLYQN